MLPGGDSALAALQAAAEAGLGPQEFLEESAERIHRMIPNDGFFLASADPESGLVMGAGVVFEQPHEICQPIWEHEFLIPDFNKFVDVAAGPTAVADLHTATGGRPERSARWRTFRGLTGYDAELRAAFTLGEATWGLAQINRESGAANFSEPEMAWLEAASPVIARGLRNALISTPGTAAARRGPGTVILSPDGQVRSATAEAEAWLADLESSLSLPSKIGIPIPVETFAYAAAARIRAERGGEGEMPPVRARLRTRSGTWLLLHASLLRGSDDIAVTIEPAKASEIAPLIVEAYGLTRRELDVTRMIARGMKTAEIADALFLSPHTVRDHVKAVFEKVGVSSRGELVAKVFADHYHDPVAESIGESHERVAGRLVAVA